jgi:hypothetical protein
MSTRLRALGADISRAWRRWSARAGSWRSELECHLTGSADRFEVELRERAWFRERDNDGSLLGR